MDDAESIAAVDRQYEWDDDQQAAITRCMNMQERIVPVTGVAGTGKTTLIREVYIGLRDAGYSVVLCAPTGKAARRITEATGIPARTIHRLLEYPYPGERDPDTGEALSASVPKRDKEHPIEYEVVLADEYAMVNLEVHRNLIDALPRGGRLCMFGDVNQLRPIERGRQAGKESPFQAALRRFNGTVLSRIHRTQEGSGVAYNGDLILKGRVPLRRDDFQLRITEQPVNVLIEAVLDALERGINFGSNDGQIISLSKRTWVGTYKINIALQELLNPIGRAKRIRLRRHTWDSERPITVGVGDKVIWTENAYDLRQPWERYEEDDVGDTYDPELRRQRYIPCPPEKTIMNGESGIIVAINEDGDINIDVGDRIVEVPHSHTVETAKNTLVQVDPRRNMDLGFCITTHKAQGSEWKHVIYVMNKSTAMMQARPNLYTAISRARESAMVITDQRSLQTSVFQQMSILERKEAMGR